MKEIEYCMELIMHSFNDYDHKCCLHVSIKSRVHIEYIYIKYTKLTVTACINQVYKTNSVSYH